MQSFALFSFAFAVLLACLYGNPFQPIEAIVTQQKYVSANLAKQDLKSSSSGLMGMMNMFLSTRQENECKAVYNSDVVQLAASYYPAIGTRLKGLSKDQQYHLCLRKIREAKQQTR